MKKLLSLLLLGIATIFLISCSKQNNLYGKYYDIYDGKAKLVLEFNENGGRFYENETRAITNIDTKNKTFTFSVNGRDVVVTYDLKENGTLKYDTGSYFTSGNENIAYKVSVDSLAVFRPPLILGSIKLSKLKEVFPCLNHKLFQ